MRFLVTAATGTTSAGVVRHLRSADEEVRGLVRDKDTATRTFDDLHGVDIVDGAFDDDVVLAKAFRGVKLPSWPWEVAPIRSGWRRPSSTARCKPDYHTWSSCRASQPATTPPCFVGRLHAEIQDHLAASGLSYTLLHPASFANNLFYKAESVQSSTSCLPPRPRVGWPTSISATCPRRLRWCSAIQRCTARPTTCPAPMRTPSPRSRSCRA